MSTPARKRLVVLGGGISGVAAARAAWELAGQVPGGVEIALVEREARAGGKARTLRSDEWLCEAGPSAVLAGEPALDRLLACSGLESERIEADASAAQRYLVRNGRLALLEPRALALLRNGILGPLGLARALCEPWVPLRHERTGDESVHDFVRRRLGAQAAARLAGPLAQGVYAGDPRKLSAGTAFPQLAELEQRHGGLLRGLRSQRARAQAQGRGGGPRLWTLRSGMQSLVESVLARTPIERHLGAPARALAREGKSWRIELERGEALQAEAVVLAADPSSAAALVSASVPELARELEAISCPPVAVVGLGYGAQAQGRVPRGFGALIGREQGLRSLGCLFEGHMFAGRGPRDGLLVRVLLGGALDPEIGTLGEGEIARIAREEMARLLGLDEAPLSEQVALWPRAIPQYELGHAERCARIAQIVERSFGLELAGTACGGVSFPRAAATGWQAGERALRSLAGR